MLGLEKMLESPVMVGDKNFGANYAGIREVASPELKPLNSIDMKGPTPFFSKDLSINDAASLFSRM